MKELLKNIFQITTTKVIVFLFGGLLLIAAPYLTSDKKEVLEEESVDSESDEYSKNMQLNQNSKRIPASRRETNKHNRAGIISSPAPDITNKNDVNYNSATNQTSYFNGRSKKDNSPSLYSPSLPTRFNPSAAFENNFPPPQMLSKDSPPNPADFFLGAPAKTQPDQNTKTNDNSSNVGGSTSTPSIANTCSADIISGTFGNPFGVTITCSNSSSVKYCLAKDSCCDPKTSGTDYTATITIGQEDGSFCLSFYGDSEIDGLTDVVQNNYVVNNTYPNLNVGSPITYFQTTELAGETFLTSTDFGKANHFAGQINFKSLDPTSSGLDYSCQEIAENDHLTLTPVPSTTLSFFDISGLLPSNEIIIPFREDKLDYGVNFLSSFIKNNSYIVPLYSCSTSQVTLEDFDYFESSMAQASTGDNNFREFEGQFSSFGFFEEDAQIFRGPAGESSNEKNGTYLKSGLLSVFY